MTIESAVLYPGHLGPSTVVRLRDQRRHAKFVAGQVRELDARDCGDLVQWGGFVKVVDLDAAASSHGFTRQQLRTLIRRGVVRTQRYRPPSAADQEVVVLDPPTLAALRTTSFDDDAGDGDDHQTGETST